MNQRATTRQFSSSTTANADDADTKESDQPRLRVRREKDALSRADLNKVRIITATRGRYTAKFMKEGVT